MVVEPIAFADLAKQADSQRPIATVNSSMSGLDTAVKEEEYKIQYVMEHEKYEREKANMPPGVFPAPPP